MKIAINRSWGGFPLHYLDYERDNPELHNRILKDDIKSVAIVEIPDAATDWEISDYDGMETVIYVLDGKIYHASK